MMSQWKIPLLPKLLKSVTMTMILMKKYQNKQGLIPFGRHYRYLHTTQVHNKQPETTKPIQYTWMVIKHQTPQVL